MKPKVGPVWPYVHDMFKKICAAPFFKDWPITKELMEASAPKNLLLVGVWPPKTKTHSHKMHFGNLKMETKGQLKVNPDELSTSHFLLKVRRHICPHSIQKYNPCINT